MVNYLEEFLRQKFEPYRESVESTSLGYRVQIAETIENLLDQNIRAVIDKKVDLVLPANIEEGSEPIYISTAQLGRDFGYLLLKKSFRNMTVSRDYSIIYSKIMSLFSRDNEGVQVEIFESLKYYMQRDIIVGNNWIASKLILALSQLKKIL